MATDQKETTSAAISLKKEQKQSSESISLVVGFNCAGTGKLLSDPYIASDGNSYELAFIEATKTSPSDSKYAKLFAKGTFGNRALKDALEAYQKLPEQQKLEEVAQLTAVKEESARLALQIKELHAQVQTVFKALDPGQVRSKRRTWEKLKATTPLEPPSIAPEINFADDPILKHTECPVSLSISEEPVFCSADGHTYEREIIIGLKKSPMNRASLKNCQLIDNHHISSAINSYKKLKQEQVILRQFQQRITQQKDLLIQISDLIKTLPLARPAPVAISTQVSPTPGPYRSAKETRWQTVLDAKDGEAFLTLLHGTTDNSTLQRVTVKGHSLAEYMALYSPWPVVPEQSKDKPSKKLLLDKLSSNGVKLPGLFKAAVLGSKDANTLLMQG